MSGFLSDQFSVSVLFYQLLTEQVPYSGLGGKAGRPEYAAANVLVAPSSVSDACRDLPGSLRDGIDRVVSRGVALDPLSRYPDRHQWVNDLFAVSASFRLKPERSPALGWLTRVVRWLAVPRAQG